MAREADLDKLLKRAKRAITDNRQFQSLEDDCFAYTMPNRNTCTEYSAGSKKVDRMFSSIGMTSLIGFANRLHMGLTPPFQKFLQFTAGPMVPEDKKQDVNEILEDANTKFFAAVQASNFNTVAPEGYMDLGVGTMAILFLEGDLDQPFNFVAAPISTIALEEGAWGGVSAVFREWKEIEIRNIVDQWKEAKIPEEMTRLRQQDPAAKVRLIEATYRDPEKKSVWWYDVIWYDGESPKDRLVERQYDECPWLTPRWMKLPGEVRGRGPVVQALPDIKTVNKIVEFVLKNAALNIAGVYTGVDDGVLNPNAVVIAPGAVIPVGSNGGSRGPSLLPLRNPGEIGFANVELEKLEMAIKYVLLDRRLPPDAGPVRSATEIVERVKELVQDLGSPFGRLMAEFIIPFAKRGLRILKNLGIITNDIVVNGLFVQAEMLSPLAQQQNLSDIENTVRALTILAGISPEIMMLSAKIEDIGPWLLEKFGTPAKFIRTSNEREALQKMAGILAAQQQQAQQQAGGIPMASAANASSIAVGGQAAGIPLAA